MQICYIWVESFRNFKNFGFNLSGVNKFYYDFKKNIIYQKEVDPIPENFFGTNIIDIIGIIGKNGAGKSNAIELICKLLKGSRTTVQSNFLIIVKNNKELHCYYSFINKNQPSAAFNINVQEYSGSVNPLKVVYFSNVFDERKNEFSNEVSDISVNKSFFRSIYYREEIVGDFEKQIRFINSKAFNDLNIDLPTQVQLTSKVWRPQFNSSSERHIYGKGYESFRELKKVFRDRLREIIPERKFVHLIRYGYFFEFINRLSRNIRFRDDNLWNQLEMSLGNFIPTLITLKTEEISENFIEFLETHFSNLPEEQIVYYFAREKNRDYALIYEKTIKQIEFLKNIKNISSKLKILYNTEGSRNKELEYFTFNYTSSTTKYFIDEYISLFSQSNSFEINWIGISSGHKAYLNLFSSLFQELRYTRHSNLLLCIDEGDLYLHPLWQIEFFDRLITVLPKIFSGEIQLVLTSHSPFLLSDLPNQNITILDKDLEGSSIDGIELNVKTFGGNLYDLYSEPFFLGQKKTSNFAYNKIKNLILEIEGKSNKSINKETVIQLANIVGDEIIQYRIKKMLEND